MFYWSTLFTSFPFPLYACPISFSPFPPPLFHIFTSQITFFFPSLLQSFSSSLNFSLSHSLPFPLPFPFLCAPPDPPESFDFKPLCTVKIDDADQLSQLKEAVEDLYYFEFVFGEAFFSDWAMLCTYVCVWVALCVHTVYLCHVFAH